jgi:hypothetical protein
MFPRRIQEGQNAPIENKKSCVKDLDVFSSRSVPSFPQKLKRPSWKFQILFKFSVLILLILKYRTAVWIWNSDVVKK